MSDKRRQLVSLTPGKIKARTCDALYEMLFKTYKVTHCRKSICFSSHNYTITPLNEFDIKRSTSQNTFEIKLL